MTKFVCLDCSEVVTDREMLRATNPFDPTEGIVGCPNCKEVNSLVGACDEPGCSEQTTCGTPTPNGYRRTCSRHMPAGVTPS
jgi:hypothetical protein